MQSSCVVDSRGAVMVEKLVVYLPLLLAFFAAWELAELTAASLVVQRASAAAGRAAMVVLPDDPRYYGGEEVGTYAGARRADIELAAGMVLSSHPRLGADFAVDVAPPSSESGPFDVTVDAPYLCGAVSLVCGGDGSVTLRSTTRHAYHGARYAYSQPAAGGDVALDGHSQAAMRLRSSRSGRGGRAGGSGSAAPCNDCPNGPDALLNQTGGGQVLRLDDATAVNSREARGGVYLTDRRVYKVYTSEDQARAALEQMQRAAANDVNVPRGLSLTQGKKRENNRCTTVWILQMNRSSGTFFQFAKPGHESLLFNAVVQTDDAEKIRRAARELMAAYCAGVMDPQGFFDPTRSSPITFIDVHTRAGRGDERLLTAANRLEQWLEDNGYRRDPQLTCP